MENSENKKTLDVPSSEMEENSITMLDVLEEEKELEEDADAVLGGSDDKNCTYPKGYVTRQALYACLTCITPIDEPAGICLACSYCCHENHELIELYTKRHFRCDCGNARFPKNPCKLFSKKTPENVENHYNQNFRGVYCTCSKPYPDVNDNIPDQMIQCIVCEDWYHGRHLGNEVPSESDYSEMICSNCLVKHSFLYHYCGHAVTKVVKEETSKNIEVCENNTPAQSEKLINHKESNNKELSASGSTLQENVEDSSIMKNNYLNEKTSQVPVLKKKSLCTMPPESHKHEGAVFWPEDWRNLLCHCKSCMEIYAKENVAFLLDTSDTVQVYEENGKIQKSSDGSQYDQGMAAFSTLGRTGQIEALYGYNTLKEELVGFLGQFARNKRVVREEDIRGFFEDLEKKKKQKTNEVVVPHFCR